MGNIIGYLHGQNPPKLYIIREHDEIFIPTRATAKSAGLDLYSPITDTIPARGKLLIDTQLKLYLPQGTYGRIAPKSGLANHYFIDVGAGVVDMDYQGNIYVLLYNHSDIPYIVQKGEAIAQLILENISYPVIEEVTSFPTMTRRGARGMGATKI